MKFLLKPCTVGSKFCNVCCIEKGYSTGVCIKRDTYVGESL